ncbi:uridine diphosphate glucose pyrophosphatase NUDT14 isoform X1 [Chiloscyllium plagiosum]|uniref:uridine diphosphate glucose pyrophosphatase NUDT14 isoform X1 n=1 Tax=Chiloscyllium plagiosum TaxID=36176 RepID=UPI001CB86EDF|nr:uridine diphosphate glucose pyrophosphatase NUDT14 isoform X1 [Chiloscyllium plagiosum]
MLIFQYSVCLSKSLLAFNSLKGPILLQQNLKNIVELKTLVLPPQMLPDLKNDGSLNLMISQGFKEALEMDLRDVFREKGETECYEWHQEVLGFHENTRQCLSPDLQFYTGVLYPGQAVPPRSGVGVTGSKHTMFYVEVSDDLHVGSGGGQAEEGELIEVVHVPLKDWQTFIFDECIPKTVGVSFAFMWFHNSIAPQLQGSKCLASSSR